MVCFIIAVPFVETYIELLVLAMHWCWCIIARKGARISRIGKLVHVGKGPSSTIASSLE
jgi:hypothetical protein